MRNENSISALKEFLNDHGFKSWAELECNQRSFTPEKALNFRTNYFIYNNLQKEVELNYFDINGVELNHYKLQPKSYILAETDQYDGQIIEITENERCMGTFGFVKDGYLIIDD